MRVRPAPMIRPADIVTRGWLSPNGGHTLEIRVPSGVVGLELGFDQVEYLERAIAAWKQTVTFEDGRSDREIHNRRPFSIEVGR